MGLVGVVGAYNACGKLSEVEMFHGTCSNKGFLRVVKNISQCILR